MVPNSPVELLYVSPDPDAILNVPLTLATEVPVKVSTPVELLYERLPNPPVSVTDTAALDLASV